MPSRPVLVCLCACAAASLGCSGKAQQRADSQAAFEAPHQSYAAHAPTPTQAGWGKCTYRYYPEAYVYYAVDRDVWFYLDGARWQVSQRLPTRLRSNLDGCVTIELETDRPYEQHRAVAAAYPAGYDVERATASAETDPD